MINPMLIILLLFCIILPFILYKILEDERKNEIQKEKELS